MGNDSRPSRHIRRALQALQPGKETDARHEAVLRQLRAEIQALPAAELDRLWRTVQQAGKRRHAKARPATTPRSRAA